MTERKSEEGDESTEVNASAVSRPPLKRMASGYNMFSSNLLASGIYCKQRFYYYYRKEQRIHNICFNYCAISYYIQFNQMSVAADC